MIAAAVAIMPSVVFPIELVLPRRRCLSTTAQQWI
jgi:hypothetical protein